MIVGCYTLDLYCDTEDCVNAIASSSPDGIGYAPGQFTHDTNERGAMAKARRAGWKLDLTNWRCICPACVTAGVKL